MQRMPQLARLARGGGAKRWHLHHGSSSQVQPGTWGRCGDATYGTTMVCNGNKAQVPGSMLLAEPRRRRLPDMLCRCIGRTAYSGTDECTVVIMSTGLVDWSGQLEELVFRWMLCGCPAESASLRFTAGATLEQSQAKEKLGFCAGDFGWRCDPNPVRRRGV